MAGDTGGAAAVDAGGGWRGGDFGFAAEFAGAEVHDVGGVGGGGDGVGGGWGVDAGAVAGAAVWGTGAAGLAGACGDDGGVYGVGDVVAVEVFLAAEGWGAAGEGQEWGDGAGGLRGREGGKEYLPQRHRDTEGAQRDGGGMMKFE